MYGFNRPSNKVLDLISVLINFDFLKKFDKIIKNQKCRKIKSKKSKKRLLVALTQKITRRESCFFVVLVGQWLCHSNNNKLFVEPGSLRLMECKAFRLRQILAFAHIDKFFLRHQKLQDESLVFLLPWWDSGYATRITINYSLNPVVFVIFFIQGFCLIRYTFN